MISFLRSLLLNIYHHFNHFNHYIKYENINQIFIKYQNKIHLT